MAATSSSLSVDPLKPAKCPISISEQLLLEDGPRKRRKINVQLNYKPKNADGSLKTTITPSSSGSDQGYILSITNEDNGNSYRYIGNQYVSEAMALIYDSTNRSFTLHRIDADFHFNLRSTPANNNAASLAGQYPQLDIGLQEVEEEADGGLFDEHAEQGDPDAETADPNNPYDYRHFLKSARAGHSLSPEPSLLGSPLPDHDVKPLSNHTSSSLARPVQSSKQVRRRSHPKTRHLSPNPREEADADNEESEADDVLTIDMGESATTNSRPWRSVLGALNEGGRSSGPISLRSAASSMSPSLRGDSDNDEYNSNNADVEEIDLDEGVEVGNQDAEVEDIESPDDESEDDEDPFAAQLENQLIAEAMSEAEQDDSGGVEVGGEYEHSNGVNPAVENRVIEESSEESEEE